MLWNWQRAEWPHFSYDGNAVDRLEEEFLTRCGEFVGAFRHVDADDRETLRIELISDEALKTSEIEGELLDRASVQSSIRRQLGLDTEEHSARPEERGIAEMMVDLCETFADPLTHEKLFQWHVMVMSGARRLRTVGGYREHEDAMQIVSGGIGNFKVHFEAPPSIQLEREMSAFIRWFNESGPQGSHPLPALTRSAICHLYFESIHPFEDGNGRIGRALSEKSLAQALGRPSLILLAHTIERGRKNYYAMLERANRDNEITEWLVYFAETILEAQRKTLERVNFHIAKTKFHDRLRGQLNERQQKVIARMFREGTEGFKGGLSAENYLSITRTSRATATRDLQDLVDKGALTRTGERRYMRYRMKLSD